MRKLLVFISACTKSSGHPQVVALVSVLSQLLLSMIVCFIDSLDEKLHPVVFQYTCELADGETDGDDVRRRLVLANLPNQYPSALSAMTTNIPSLYTLPLYTVLCIFTVEMKRSYSPLYSNMVEFSMEADG